MPNYQNRVQQKKANQALRRLYSLPGMDSIKTQVEQMVKFAKISKLREEQGLKTSTHTYHMVFTGNPGTGKTTAARLIGKAFAAMGLLKTDQEEIPFVEIHHADVAHPHVGESEIRIKEKFETARGGVLFIDEAYSFLGKSDHRTDDKVIALIVQKMEDMREELIVIAAGYPNEMEDFLNSNPGLRSRFSNTISFPDYKVEDLLKIAQFIVDEQEYEMDSGFKVRLSERLGDERLRSGFGNGRTVRNIIEKSIQRQSVRVSKLEGPIREDLVSLIADDIEILSYDRQSEKEKLFQMIEVMKERISEIEFSEMLS